MNRAVRDIQNYYFPVTKFTDMRQPIGGKEMQRNLTYYISPVQFQRIKHDIAMWREAITEAELAFFPQRVKMQRMFQDTGLNEHITACVKERKRLTLLRDFQMCNAKGKDKPELTNIFRQMWFRNFQNHVLNALFYGYSLITLGDLVNDAFPNVDVIRRHNVSPDRLNVTSYIYSLSGENFTEVPYVDWHIWVPTPTELGVGNCGYGLFYEIAKTEILLRNNVGYNADYQEVFGQPIRVGKTTKTDEYERRTFEKALSNMGSQAYILLDDGQDTIELIESKNTGTAYQSYGDFERRLEQKISKVILGHGDAMTSVPGKLGSGQGGDDSPINKALTNIQIEDGIFAEHIINGELIPRMRKFGFQIPMEFHFEYLNNKEVEDFRRKVDESNQKTAAIAQTLKSAGLQMDPKYFEDRTGIPVTMDSPLTGKMSPVENALNRQLSMERRKRLNRLYSHA
jgi:hypothetical protein